MRIYSPLDIVLIGYATAERIVRAYAKLSVRAARTAMRAIKSGTARAFAFDGHHLTVDFWGNWVIC